MSSQLAFSLPFVPASGLEDFLVTGSNRAAWDMIVVQSPAQWPTHALLLYGDVGSGKSHLAQIWMQRQAAQLLPVGTPVIDQILARSAPAYCLEDAQSVTQTYDRQIWLQHVYNATKEAATPLLLTARQPAQFWSLELADVRSRLNSIAMVKVNAADDALLRGLLMKLFADRQLRIDDESCDYLIKRLPRAPGLYAEFVARIDQVLLMHKRSMTIHFFRKFLEQE